MDMFMMPSERTQIRCTGTYYPSTMTCYKGKAQPGPVKYKEKGREGGYVYMGRRREGTEYINRQTAWTERGEVKEVKKRSSGKRSWFEVQNNRF